MPTETPETIYTDAHTVGCDGGGGSLGHPLVYLPLDNNHEIFCPYCSRHYIFKESTR